MNWAIISINMMMSEVHTCWRASTRSSAPRPTRGAEAPAVRGNSTIAAAIDTMPSANIAQKVARQPQKLPIAVPIGTPAAGSPPHLAALRLQLLTQTRLNIVTFPSAPAARQAVVAGNVVAAALVNTDGCSTVSTNDWVASGSEPFAAVIAIG